MHLIIFAHGPHARRAGFRDTRHPGDPDLRAWWPALGADHLRGHRWSRVTVTESALQYAQEQGTPRLREDLARGLSGARTMLRLEPMLWMEL